MTDYMTAINDAIWTGLFANPNFMAQFPFIPGQQMNLVWPKNALNLSGKNLSNGSPGVDSLLPFLFSDLYRTQAATDFPKAVLNTGDIVDAMYSAKSPAGVTPTFSTLSNAGPVDWFEPIQCQFTLSLVFRDMQIAQNNPIKLGAVQAIRNLGPRLGLSYVVQAGPCRIGAERPLIPAERDPSTGRPIGAIRSKSDILIPVLVKFHGSQLS
jgi:hypothetical protein